MAFSFEDIKSKAKLVFTRDAGDESESETTEERQPDRLEELAEYCPILTLQQRLMGFLVSFSLGCKFLTAVMCDELAHNVWRQTGSRRAITCIP
jgi:hypothetical protein